MKTKTLITIIISLVVGAGIGYVINTSSPKAQAPIMMMDHSMMGHSMPEMDAIDMNAMMMDMTARMQGKTGDELDRIFLEDMIIHHQGAVDMAIIIKEQTSRQELKDFAQEIIDVQDQEINMMKNWLTQWSLTKNN